MSPLRVIFCPEYRSEMPGMLFSIRLSGSCLSPTKTMPGKSQSLYNFLSCYIFSITHNKYNIIKFILNSYIRDKEENKGDKGIERNRVAERIDGREGWSEAGILHNRFSRESRTIRAWGPVRSETERADLTALSSVGISNHPLTFSILFFDLNASHRYLSTISTMAKHLFTFSSSSSIYLDTCWLLTE